MDTAFSQLGLEPSKQAYNQKMAALRSEEKQSEEKPQSKLSKLLFGNRDNTPSPAAKPCTGKDCPKPKPCPGRNCTPVTSPPPPPVTGSACRNGSPNQFNDCAPWGYIDRCDNQTCYAHLARVNVSSCTDILKREQVEEKQADLLKTAQENSCSADLQSAECNAASGDYEGEMLIVDQLRQQYQMCLSAAGYSGTTTGVTVPPSRP